MWTNCPKKGMNWLVRACQHQFRKYPRYKSRKVNAFLQLIRDSMLSTPTLRTPPSYIKVSFRFKVGLARNTERKLKLHWFRKFSTSLKFHITVNSQKRWGFVELAWCHLPLVEFLFEPVAKLVCLPNTSVFVIRWPYFTLNTGNIDKEFLPKHGFYDVSSHWRCLKWWLNSTNL